MSGLHLHQRSMDIQRQGVRKRKLIRWVIAGVILLAAAAAGAQWLRQLEPALPSVEAGTVWPDEALNRFTGAYAPLARLPAPKMQSVGVRDWILRVVRREQRLAVTVSHGPEITIQADPDQLE